MPKPAYQKITKRFVDNVDIPKSGQAFYNDSELHGFKLRVNATGVKAYVVERRVNGKNRRFVIGKHGIVTPELARKEAIRLLGAMAVGDDPVRRKQEQQIKAITLGEVLKHYFANTKLRQNTISMTVGVLNRCVPDWLTKPITSITANMIIERHQQLPHKTVLGTSGKVEANICIVIVNRLMNYAINNFELPDGSPVLPINPVRRFVRNRGWHDEPQRRNVIPDQQTCQLVPRSDVA